MADYHSDVHLPKWRQRVIWLMENPVGQFLWMAPTAVLAFLPAYWLGIWWPVLIIVAGLSFVAGWNAARRKWLRGERLDKL